MILKTILIGEDQGRRINEEKANGRKFVLSSFVRNKLDDYFRELDGLRGEDI